MKNYRFYIITALVLILIQCVMIFWSSGQISKVVAVKELENDLGHLKQITDNYAFIFTNGATTPEQKDIAIQKLQHIASGTEMESLQLSAIDWSGSILAHPDITQVGVMVSDETTALGSDVMSLSADSLYTELRTKVIKPVYLRSIPDTDIILIGSIHLGQKYEGLKKLKQQLFINLSVIGLVALVVVFAVIRWLSVRYENKMAERSAQFQGSISGLQKLNTSLERYQEKLSALELVSKQTPDQEDTKELDKRRILTYLRNELLPVNINDISYIYVENTITYIVQKSGKRSTSSDSLDTIYKHLDAQLFFRVNRQIIVAISAIETIIKYGNSQLKLKVIPAADIDIIIGKNKAAAFKQWLDL